MNPFEFLDEFFIPKTRVVGLSVGEDFVILACVVFTQYQRVTDRQTDIPTMASTGLAATLTPCKNASEQIKQESPAVADKPARRLRKVCTVYVIAVGL